MVRFSTPYTTGIHTFAWSFALQGKGVSQLILEIQYRGTGMGSATDLFHGMENFCASFPQYGKLFGDFSTLWKTVFHAVEQPSAGSHPFGSWQLGARGCDVCRSDAPNGRIYSRPLFAFFALFVASGLLVSDPTRPTGASTTHPIRAIRDTPLSLWAAGYVLQRRLEAAGPLGSGGTPFPGIWTGPVTRASRDPMPSLFRKFSTVWNTFW